MASKNYKNQFPQYYIGNSHQYNEWRGNYQSNRLEVSRYRTTYGEIIKIPAYRYDMPIDATTSSISIQCDFQVGDAASITCTMWLVTDSGDEIFIDDTNSYSESQTYRFSQDSSTSHRFTFSGGHDANCIKFYFEITNDSSTVFITNPSVDFTVSIADLSIKSITPDPLVLSNDSTKDKVTVSFNNRLNAKLGVTFKAGTKQLYSGTATSDSITVDCPATWFTGTSETMNISVSVTDQSSGFTRTANSSFALKMPQLSVDLVTEDEIQSDNYARFTVGNELGSDLKLTVKYGNSTKIDNEELSAYRGNYGEYWVWCDTAAFDSITSDQVTVTLIVSDAGLSRRQQQTTFTLLMSPAGLPNVDDISLENVPYSSALADKGYVKNYSKVKITASVDTYFGTSSVKVSGGGLSQAEMQYDAWKNEWTATTTSVITGATTFSVTVTDNRSKIDTDSKTLEASEIETLPDIKLSRNPSSGNIYAGDAIEITAENFIGNYSYAFKKGTTTFASSPGTRLTTITQTCNPDWFTKAKETGKTLSVTYTVTDAIERSVSLTFYVEMPDFKLILDKQRVLLDGDLGIKVVGKSNPEVSYRFLIKSSEEPVEPEDDGYIEFATASTSEDEWKTSDESIEFTKALFTQAGVEDKATLQAKIDATCGTLQSASIAFWIDFPTLILTLSGDEAAVGDPLTYTFDNRENEQITLEYYYQQRKLTLPDTYQYNVDEATINTPQLFDPANANTVQTIYVSAVINDNRGRTARVDNIKVNVSESMRPVISDFTVAPINPDTLDSKFEGEFISNISKIRVSATITPTTNATISKENVYFSYNGARYQAASKNGNVFARDIDTIVIVNNSGSQAQVGESFGIFLEGTDQRNMSFSIVFFPYARLYHSPSADIAYHRCTVQDGVITPSDQGEWCTLTVHYNFAGLWINSLPPSVENQGTITVSTTGYTETQNSWLQGHNEEQAVDLTLGYGLNSSGEIVENSLRAATTNPIVFEEEIYLLTNPIYVEFDGDYYVDYALWENGRMYNSGQINSGDRIRDIYILANSQLYLSLRRKTENSTPVDISEANVRIRTYYDSSETGTAEFLIPNMDMEHSYDINITLQDLITVVTYTVRLSTAGVIMDFLAGGKGIGLGKVAESKNQKCVEVNPEWTLLAEKIKVKISDESISSLNNYGGQVLDLGTVLKYILDKL